MLKKILFFTVLALFFFLFPFVSPKVEAYGLTPAQIKAAYGLPNSGGTGTVAIIAPYHPNVENDLNTFSQQFGLPSCTQSNGCLTIKNMSSSTNTAGAGETSMDTQWVHAVAPEAKILLVEIGSFSSGQAVGLIDQDMFNAIQYVESLSDVRVLSMSFGDSGDNPGNCGMFTNSNIVAFASTGDNGNATGFPALCSQVVAVGGTTLNMNGTNFLSETAWAGSGGGLSQSLSEPNYQKSFDIPNANGFRGEPDISAVGDPATGAVVFVNGQAMVFAGTSLSAPIWAGIAGLNSNLITHDMLYGNGQSSTYPQYYRDITQGSNGSCQYYCQARVSYDYITGLGVPIALPGSGGNTLPPAPTGNPTGSPTSTPGSPPNVSYSISGSVYSDANNNNQKDPGEGVLGAQISLSGTLNSNTTTNSNGDYSFLNLTAGTYTVSASIGGLSSNGTVSLSTGYPQAKFDFKIIPGQNPIPVTPQPTSAPTLTVQPTDPDAIPFDTPTPAPVPYTCAPDPTCVAKNNNLQMCALICTPL